MEIFAQTQSANWFSYLPSFFQQPASLFTVLVAFAAFGLAKSFPRSDKWPWIPEVASIAGGVAVACGLKVGDSYVYSAGFGLISAWGASSFYSLGFSWLTARLRSITGQPATPTVTPPETITDFRALPSHSMDNSGNITISPNQPTTYK